MTNMTTPRHRRWARRFALQALYQWEITRQAMPDIEKQFRQDKEIERADLDYFNEILHGVLEQQENIETYIKRYIDRPLTELDPVELSILRLGIYELLKRPDVPYRVILNEGLELGKMFGATDGYKFVNGILDKAAREIRQDNERI